MPPLRPTRLSMYARERIVSLWRQGRSYTNIRQDLIDNDNISVSRNAICSFLLRFRRTGSMLDLPRNFNRPRILQPQHMDFIDNAIDEDNEISAQELVTKLRDTFQVTVSVATVKRARQLLGWERTTTQYCQMIRDANKPKRLQFALRCMATNESFDDCIFTDETTVKIQTTTRHRFRRRGERPVLRGRPKHPYQVHVWGGISRRGATGLFLFNCTMDSLFYQEILRQRLVPFINTTFPDGHRFVQDNDPKHVSHSTRAYMQNNNINHWPTPLESPDMNTIENVWAQTKYHIRRRKKPRNQQELLEGIGEAWATMTPAVCGRYIDHLYKVIPAIVEREGAASGY